jgi:adenylylsulfate kinase-like enzyme
VKRDPKGIYARAASGEASTVPGIQDVYEPPSAPEATVDGQRPPEESAEAIIGKLRKLRAI